MPSNGERLICNQNMSRDLYLQHMGRYLFASSNVSGKIILDAACGSGFGSEILSQKAAKVVGIDNSWDAILYCKTHYIKPNLHFVQGDCNCLSFPDFSFDMIISFETLEHLQDTDSFLQELKRVLKDGGQLIMSTPNRDNFSIYTKGVKNPFHVKEFAQDEFVELVTKFFQLEKLLGQKYFSKKDIPLLNKCTNQHIPHGYDGPFRKTVRIFLRKFLSKEIRSDFFLSWEVWANKCKVGDITPAKSVYLIGIFRKL